MITVCRSNIDPVNSFRQQAMFARRVRPIVEGAGATFLDTYRATRRAVLQKTPHAIRFDHFSAFHFFDSGRYAHADSLPPSSHRAYRERLDTLPITTRYAPASTWHSAEAQRRASRGRGTYTSTRMT